MQIMVLKDCCDDRLQNQYDPLRELGFEVSVVESLEQLQKTQATYDLVVLDISNLQSPGLDLFCRLKSTSKDIPVIVFAAHKDSQTALEFIRMGAQDYLIKGITGWESFQRRINFAVECNRHQRFQLNSEMRMRMLLEQSFDAFIIIDSQWKIQQWNFIAEKTFGWKQEEALGKKLNLIIPFHLQSLFLKKMNLPRTGGSGNYFKTQTELILKHRSGKTFSCELGIIPAGNAPGNFCVFIRDVSKQKEFNEELERLVLERTEKLSRSNEELEQFAKIASHDLQEPLRAIKGFAQLLSRKNNVGLDSECKEFVDFILDGTNRMSELVQSILTHAQINKTDGLEPRTDCNSVIIDVLTDLHTIIEETETSFDLDTLPELAVERSHLMQLFQNLISNSIKYKSGNSPRITITAEKVFNQWLFTYRDNGIGIESCYSEKVFEMFSRLHPKGKHSGTGIGLAICKRVVSQYGGNIWVEPGLDEGSVFMFTLPDCKENVKKQRKNKVRNEMKDFAKDKIEILLVEDTPSDVRLTQEALKESPLDYDLTIVSDGVEALEYLNNLKESVERKMPQVILLDLNMPRKNGHELLEDISADPVLRTIPVVLLTVSEREADVMEALRTKMNFYLAKPVTSERLCTLLKTLHELHVENCLDNGIHSQEEWHVRFVLAGNPHTANFALERLSDDSHERIRAKVAENSRIKEHTQLKLARDPQPAVRISLCENPSLTDEVIALLASDEDHDVRLAVTSSPSVKKATLEKLVLDENVFVSDSAKKSLDLLEQGLFGSVSVSN